MSKLPTKAGDAGRWVQPRRSTSGGGACGHPLVVPLGPPARQAPSAASASAVVARALDPHADGRGRAARALDRRRSISTGPGVGRLEVVDRERAQRALGVASAARSATSAPTKPPLGPRATNQRSWSSRAAAARPRAAPARCQRRSSRCASGGHQLPSGSHQTLAHSDLVGDGPRGPATRSRSAACRTTRTATPRAAAPPDSSCDAPRPGRRALAHPGLDPTVSEHAASSASGTGAPGGRPAGRRRPWPIAPQPLLRRHAFDGALERLADTLAGALPAREEEVSLGAEEPE